MNIEFHKDFIKHLDRLPRNIQLKTINVLDKFCNNPYDPSLENHALKGKLKGKRAISVADNIRISFKEYEHYTTVLLLNIGSHDTVYK